MYIVGAFLDGAIYHNGHVSVVIDALAIVGDKEAVGCVDLEVLDLCGGTGRHHGNLVAIVLLGGGGLLLGRRGHGRHSGLRLGGHIFVAVVVVGGDVLRVALFAGDFLF